MQHTSTFSFFKVDPLPPILRKAQALIPLFAMLILLGIGENVHGQAQPKPINPGDLGNPVTLDFNDLAPVAGQVNVPGRPYMVNFDGGPTPGNNGIAGDNGSFLSTPTPGVFVYENGVPINKALALRVSTSNSNTKAYLGLTFVNNTGQPLKCIRVKYKALLVIEENANNPRYPFSVLVSPDALPPSDLKGPGWINHTELDAFVPKNASNCNPGPRIISDETLPGNQSDKDFIISFQTPIPDGRAFTFRWVVNFIPGTCFQPDIAIDEFSIRPYSETPRVPNNPVLALFSSPCDNSMRLTWQAPPIDFPLEKYLGYELQLKINGNNQGGLIFVPKGQTDYVFQNLTIAGNYSVDVRVKEVGFAGCGNSSFRTSNTVFGYTPPGPVSAAATPNIVCGTGTVRLVIPDPPSIVDNVIWEQSSFPCNIANPFLDSGLRGLGPGVNVTASTCFRANITYNNPSLCNRMSVLIPVEVREINAGTISPATVAPSCSPLNVNLTLSGQNGEIQWQKQENCFGPYNDIPGAITTVYSFNNLNDTYCYRVKITHPNDAGCVRFTNEVRYQINEAPQAGQPQALRANICVGDTARVSVPFFSGSIQWQQAPGPVCSLFTNVSPRPGSDGRQFFYNPGPLTQSTCYRAVVSRPNCPSVTTNNTLITVTAAPTVPQFVGGRGSRNICAGSVQTFEVANPVLGATYVWSGWPVGVVPIGGQGTPSINLSFTGVNSGAFDLHVRVVNGSCAATTEFANGLPLNIVQQTLPATLNPTLSRVCPGNQTPVILNLANDGRGNVLRWEFSYDNFTTAPTVVNVQTNTLDVVTLGLTQNARVRAIMQSGNCLDLPTRAVSVEVGTNVQPATVSPANSTVCSGANSTLITLGNFSGGIIRWESSTDNFVTNTVPINNINSFLNPTGLTQTTYFRALTSVPGCASVPSQVATVNVEPQTVPGVISGTAQVCTGTNTGTLTLDNTRVGNVIRWESSVDNFATTVQIPNSDVPSITFNNLTQTTRFRAFVQSGNCQPLFSQPFVVTVSAQGNAGFLSGPVSVCPGNGGNLRLIGGNFASIARWESSESGFTVNDIFNISETSSNYNFSNLTRTTSFRVVVNGVAGCGGTSTSNVVTVDVPVLPNNATVTAQNTNICAGISTTLTLQNGNMLPIQKWQRSVGSCTGTWVDINSNNSTLNTNFLTESTCYRAVVANANCPGINSNEVLINVTKIVADSIRVTNISCGGAADGKIRLFYSGSNNLIYTLVRGGQTLTQNAPNNEFTGLAAGGYIIRVTDANGCAAAEEFRTVTQNASNFAITSFNVTNASCQGPNTGAVDITVSGATGNIIYNWSGPNGFTSSNQDISGLALGTYSVTAIDDNGNGCSVRNSYTVTGATGFTVTQNVTQPSCSGRNNGAIVLTFAGGNRPLTVTWADGLVQTVTDNTAQRTDLAAGNYTFTADEGSGCAVNREIRLVPGGTISVNVTAQNVGCANEATGLAQVTASGGTPPYTAVWSNNQSGLQIFGLTAGTYSVTVSDGNGCTQSGSVEVRSSSGPVAPTVTAAPNQVCVGSRVRLTAVSSEGLTRFQWFQNQNDIFAFTANESSVIEVTAASEGTKTYYVQVVTSFGVCTTSRRVPVSFTVVNSGVNGVIEGPTSICSGQSVRINLTNANAVQVVRWESQTNPQFPFTAIAGETLPGLTVNNLTQTTRFRAVVQSGSCNPSPSNVVEVTVSPNFVPGTVTGGTSICANEPSSDITLTLSGNSNGSSVVRWESSTDNFNTDVRIVNQALGNTITVTPPNTTTSFRAIVTSNTCPIQRESSSATVTVRNCGGIAVSESNINFGNVRLGCESILRSYRVTGESLTGDISVEAPAGLLVSDDAEENFAQTLTLFRNGNGQVSGEVFVKVAPNAAVGANVLNIVHRTENRPSVSVTVRATVENAPAPVITTSVPEIIFGNVPVNTLSDVKSYTLNVANSGGTSVQLQVAEPFYISNSPAGPFTSQTSFPVTGCNLTETVYVRFEPKSLQSPNQEVRFVIHSNLSSVFNLRVTGFAVLNPSEPQPDIVVDDDFDNDEEVDDLFGPGAGFDFGVNALNDLQTAVDRTGDNKTLLIAGRDIDGSNVVVDNPMTITGQGDARTYIEPKGNMVNNYEGDDPEDALAGNFTTRHALIIKADGVDIKNLTIDGGSSNPCDQKFGVGIITDSRTGDEYDDLDVENVDIRNVYSRGIQISGRGDDHDIKNVDIVNVCQRLDPDPRVAAEAAGIYSDDQVNISDVSITDAGTGVILRNFGGIADKTTSIQRARINNVNADGIQVDMRSNQQGRVIIEGNSIEGVGDAGIEALGLPANAVVGGSTELQKNRISIKSRNAADPGTGIRMTYSDGAVIQNNEINAEGEETGIELFQNDDRNNPVVVRNNELKRSGNFATNPSLNEAVGVFMSDNGQYVNAANAPSYAKFEGNTIEGYNIGIFTNGTGVEGNVFAEIVPDANGVSNTIRNAKEGIRVNGRSRARVARNARSIENSDIGVYVYGGDLLLDQNALHGNRIAVLIEDKPGFTGTATIFDNTFYNNGKNVVNNSAAPGNVINASWNWWGTVNPADVRSKLEGRIDYSPFFNDNRDADNNLNNGWQGIRDFVHADGVSLKTAPEGHLQEAFNDTKVLKINVTDGLYDETFTVNRNITLTNDGIGANPIVMNVTMASGSANLTLEQSFDLTGELALNGGRVNVLGDRVLTVLRGGVTTTGSDNSYVNGTLARQAGVAGLTDLYFPIGSSSAFRPATLSVTQSMNGLATYFGRVNEPNNLIRQVPSGISRVSQTRSHNFRRTGAGTMTGSNIRLAFGNGDPVPSEQNSVVILKDNDGTGTSWNDIGGTPAGNNISSGTPITTLGNFVLAVKPVDNGGGNNGGGNNGGGGTTDPITAAEITAVSNITVTSAVIRWSMPTCSSPLFEFRYRMAGEQNWTVISNMRTTNYFMVGLQPGTRYEISVRSQCPGRAFSEWSIGQLTSFMTLPAGSCDGPTPPVPGGVRVTNVGATSARLSWNLSTNAPGQGTIINFGPINQNSSNWVQTIVCHPQSDYTFTNLRSNTVYGVRVRTNCTNCFTALNTNDRRSNWSSVIPFSTLSFRELNDENGSAVSDLTLYPNPNEGVFNLSFASETEEELSVRIIDLKGSVVFSNSYRTSEGMNTIPFELSGYPEGIYHLTVVKGDRVSTVKLQVR